MQTFQTIMKKMARGRWFRGSMTGNTYLNLILQKLLSEHTKSQMGLLEGGSNYRHV